MKKKRKSDLRIIYAYGIPKVINTWWIIALVVDIALRLFFQKEKESK